METEIIKTVDIRNQTKRGHTIRVNGGKGMFSLAISKNKTIFNSDKQEHWLYTNELDGIISTLTAFRDAIQAKHEI